MADYVDIIRGTAGESSAKTDYVDIIRTGRGTYERAERPAGKDRGFLTRTLEFFTGETPGQTGLPEMGSMRGLDPATAMGAGVGISANPRPEVQADIIRNLIPGSKVTLDEYGNVIVDLSEEAALALAERRAEAAGNPPAVSFMGIPADIVQQETGPEPTADAFRIEPGRYVVNEPGASVQDIFDVLVPIAEFTPAVRAGGAASTLGGRVVATSLASGGTSLANDALAAALGSEQGIDVPAFVLTTAFGALGELGSAGLGKLYRSMRGSRFVDAEGRLTERARTVLTDLGIDPATITPASARRLEDLFARVGGRFGADAEAAVNVTQSGRFGIPLTRGQATQNPSQLQREFLMRQGGFGDRAQRVFLGNGTDPGFDAIQRRDVQRAALQIIRERGETSGRAQINAERVAGDEAFEAILQSEQALSRQITEAYNRVPFRDFRLDGESLGTVFRFVREELGVGTNNPRLISPDLTPQTMDALRRVRDLRRTLTEAENPEAVRVSLARIERTRQELGALFDRAVQTGEARDIGGVLAVRRAFDRWFDDAVDNTLAGGAGDDMAQTVLEALGEGRALRRDYARLYETNPRAADVDAGRLIQRFIERDMTGQEVIDSLFGRSMIGNATVTTRALERVKAIVGEGTPAWDALRQAALIRTFFGPAAGQSQNVSYRTMARNLDGLLEGRGLDAARVLFSADEIAELQAFRQAIKNVEDPDNLIINRSGSAAGMSRIVQGAFDMLLPVVSAAVGGVDAGLAAGFAARGGRSLTNARSATLQTNAMTAFPAHRLPFVVLLSAAGGEDIARESGNLVRELTAEQ